jgi:hypothetical protein
VRLLTFLVMVWGKGGRSMARIDTDNSGEAPALAKVSIFEVTLRPWGELITDARRDDRIFVGSPEWRRANKTP